MAQNPGTPSLDALERTTWQDLTRQAHDYVSLWSGFEDLALTSAESGDLDAAAACQALAGICSLLPSDEQLHEPYQPMLRLRNQRSFLPDDLTDADLEFLTDLLPRSENPKLTARVGDMIWARRYGPAPHQAAISAVVSWLQVPIDDASWNEDVHENWPRFLQVARQLRLTEQLASARSVLESAFQGAGGGTSLDLAELIMGTGPIDNDARRRIANRLAFLAEEERSFTIARQLHLAAARLYERIGDVDEAGDQLYAVVQGRVGEAEQRAVDSAAVANSHYESALRDYRQIPMVQRQRLDIIGLGDELAGHIRASGVAALDEMSVFRSEGIDLSRDAEAAKEFVGGHNALEATKRFIGLAQYLSEQDHRENAELQLSESAILGLVSVRHFSGDGRVVHRSSTDESGPWGYTANVWDAMLRGFDAHVQLVTKGRILPALEVLVNEHPIRVRDFLVVTEDSEVVPRDRARTVARALAAGYNYDFTAALYMLIPQIENIVRNGLQRAGALTTTISDGIEQEIGLSSLLERPQMTDVFDSDIVFELRALFGGPTGANLRNEVAHGLLSDGEASSKHSVYAWWFLLRLVYAPYWHRVRDNAEDKSAESGGDGSAGCADASF